MNYLLDTNIIVHNLRGKYSFVNKFENIGYDKFYLSYISKIELNYGAYCSDKPSKNLAKVEKQISLFNIYELNDAIFDIFIREKVNLRKKDSEYLILICLLLQQPYIII